ncbi:unnamed protein product [Parnassius mnemosyne]|uniref:THAP-type domain-containing protein n=1 Tax=Parnassius mnemosyne TaxID=213953 RepID=A0AAV1LV37_9NEOP
MDSERTCCVPSCKRPRSPGTPLHGFPNPVLDPDRFRTWLYAIGGDILGLDNQYIYKYRNVCRHNFKPCYHFGNRRLTNNAIPTLNMPGPSVTRREPMADITSRMVNVEENIFNMPSTSRDVTAPQTSHTQNCDFPKTTLRAGGIKSKHSFKNVAKVMAHQIAKLKKVKDSYSQRLKKALKLSENPTFLKTIKNFSAMAAIFTLLQLREINKPKMGGRFTQEEKIMALSLYKHGPKAYRWMSKVFVLPSYMTLSRLISRAALKPGINENIFEMLKKATKKMKDDSKLCVLLFDEIALSPHFDYSKRKDRISGFVDNGKKNLPIIADHALVFMIRGIYKNYKQPISYTFSSGSTKKHELTQQIKENISQLQRIGFKVLSTVCDQGASNVSALNQLIEETRADYLRREKEYRYDVFTVNDQEVIPLYDAPHLIKGIRNNLITKNLKYKMNGQIKIAKWEHLKLLHQENPAYKGIRKRCSTRRMHRDS